jgi:ABC-type Na+ efflux pump permease subunit
MRKLFGRAGLLLTGLAMMPVAAAADVANNENGVPTGLNPVNAPANLGIAHLLVVIITWILGFSAAVAVIFLIIGGLQFVSSAGNSDRVTKAKQTILYAVLGIIVIILAFVIVFFINNNLNSAVNTTP